MVFDESSRKGKRSDFEAQINKEGLVDFALGVLMQDLLDFDALMRTEYGYGYGRIQDWVFAKLASSREDRGLYIRMMEALDCALDEGSVALDKLELRVVDDGHRMTLMYGDKRTAMPLMVTEVDEENVRFRLQLPSQTLSNREDHKVIYQLGKRGVDGLLEHLGFGCYGLSEKFSFWENLRHWWERGELEDRGLGLWWVDGDRRSFVVVQSRVGLDSPTARHFFQLGGGFWGSRSVDFAEATQLGQQKGRRVIP